MSEREMKIRPSEEQETRLRRGERLVLVRSIPWGMFDDAAEQQAMRTHRQTLQRLSERGGLSAIEAVCILSSLTATDRGVTFGSDDNAHRILYSMRALYRRHPEATAPLSTGSPAEGGAS